MKFELGNKTTYNNISDKCFKETLNKLLPPQYEIEMKNYLTKYEDFKWNEDKKTTLKVYKDKIKANEEKSWTKQQILNKSLRLHSFNQLYEQNGIDQWKKNIIKRKENISKDLKYELSQARNYSNKVNSLIKSSEMKTSGIIGSFESKLMDTNSYFYKSYEKGKEDINVVNDVNMANMNSSNNKKRLIDENLKKLTKDSEIKSIESRLNFNILNDNEYDEVNYNNNNKDINNPYSNPLESNKYIDKYNDPNDVYVNYDSNGNIKDTNDIKELTSQLITDKKKQIEENIKKLHNDTNVAKTLNIQNNLSLSQNDTRTSKLLGIYNNKQSNQEKEFDYQKWKFIQTKNVINQNSNLYERLKSNKELESRHSYNSNTNSKISKRK